MARAAQWLSGRQGLKRSNAPSTKTDVPGLHHYFTNQYATAIKPVPAAGCKTTESQTLVALFTSKQGFYTSHPVVKLSPLVSHYAISQKNLHECDTAAEILRINSFGQPCDECGTWERSRHDIYEKDEIGAASATAAPHVQKLCFDVADFAIRCNWKSNSLRSCSMTALISRSCRARCCGKDLTFELRTTK